MKKIFAILAAFAALTSCSVKELTGPESSAGSPILHASFEGLEGTRTFVDGGLHLFWTADDRLSVFLGTTYNQQYRFTGETGDNAGDFEEVPASGLHSGSDVNAIYAVYPYRTTTKLSYDGKITVDLPAVQQYAPGTFGPGANTMVAVTAGKSDTFLPFKNLCGYLVVKFYGSGTVKSVTIEGNNGEKLAGKATVTASHTAAPTLVLADDATTSITIDCGEGVTLGSTAETATEFWFCIPPVTFSKGFTITATGSAGSFSKSTTGSRTIERNVRVSMPALEFIPDGPAVPEMVDLGLPSGIKWASFNLGASKPEEYGGYYQWAGLQDVTDTSIYLNWGNCPYHTGSVGNTGWTKYIPFGYSSYWSGSGSPDNKTVLDTEDDVTHVKLGGKWRMPTKAEFEELYNNCTSEWTTLNGVNGRKFTSKKNGNCIFLPAASCRGSGGLGNAGSSGFYWFSSLYPDLPFLAYYMYFDSFYVGTNDDGSHRFIGLSVRPVYGDKVSVTGVSLSKTSLSLEVGETSTLSATISPSSAAEQSVGWSSNNPTVATVDAIGKVTALKTGSATITVKTTDGGYTATCQVTVVSAGPAVPEAVDLGLPSGLKWASCNLGASKPEEYGGYYQWGGLQDVTNTSIYLDWDNCPYHTIGADEIIGWTKYIPWDKSSYWYGPGSPDDKTVLDLNNDIAHVILDDKWRMPTEGECRELIIYCYSNWATLNGVSGLTLTSKKNGNSIFLPAAGGRNGGILYYEGSRGHYWSSSLCSDHPSEAWYLGIGNVAEDVFTNGGFRNTGLSVRPVYGDIVKATGITLDKTSLSLDKGEHVWLTASMIPANAQPDIVWSSSNSSVAFVSEFGSVTANGTGVAVITASLSGNSSIKATCTVTVKPDMVDLGLPSGLKWASCNLGASSPEEYGGYYQWAGLEDVTDKSIYLDYSNCPYHTGSSDSTGWTKYVPSGESSYWSGSGSPDNKTVLDPEDDVAHVMLGGKWRMPTRAEFTELLNNCTLKWTTLNGVNGWKFTSKKNGNCIFLPAAGFRRYDYLSHVGSYCYYWSSSLLTGSPYNACGLYFFAGNLHTSSYYRYTGQSVRPVSE